MENSSNNFTTINFHGGNICIQIYLECDITLFMSNYKMANVVLTGVEYGCFLLPRT